MIYQVTKVILIAKAQLEKMQQITESTKTDTELNEIIGVGSCGGACGGVYRRYRRHGKQWRLKVLIVARRCILEMVA